MALEAGRIVMSAGNIEPLNFELEGELSSKEKISGRPTIEVRRMEGEDILEIARVPNYNPYLKEGDRPLEGGEKVEDGYIIGADGDYVANASFDPMLRPYDKNEPPPEAGVSADGKTASITVRALPSTDKEPLNSIWEVICYVKTKPGGNAFSASMIVVGEG